MRKLKTIIYLILVSIFLSACSIINADHVSVNPPLSVSYNFNSNFSSVWKAVIHALSKDEVIKYITKTMDDTVGIVVTEYNSVDDKDIKYTKNSYEKRTYKCSYTINLYTQNANQTTVKIVVNLLTSQFGFYQDKPIINKLESDLRKQIITRICNNLFPNNTGECYTLSPDATDSPPPLQPQPHGPQQKVGDAQTIKVQKALNDAGYEAGHADGILGEQTRRALQEFQKDNNLPVTKQIDQSTLILLGIIQKKPEEKLESISEKRIAPPKKQYVTLKETELKAQKEVFSISIAKIPAGSQLAMIADEGDWYKVMYGKMIGYVDSSAVRSDSNTTPPIRIKQLIAIPSSQSNQAEPDEEKEPTNPQPATREPISKGVTNQACILWSEAGTTGDILADIPKGTPLDIVETVSYFYKVKYQDKEGFVYIYFVEKNDDK